MEALAKILYYFRTNISHKKIIFSATSAISVFGCVIFTLIYFAFSFFMNFMNFMQKRLKGLKVLKKVLKWSKNVLIKMADCIIAL